MASSYKLVQYNRTLNSEYVILSGGQTHDELKVGKNERKYDVGPGRELNPGPPPNVLKDRSPKKESYY